MVTQSKGNWWYVESTASERTGEITSTKVDLYYYQSGADPIGEADLMYFIGNEIPMECTEFTLERTSKQMISKLKEIIREGKDLC